MSSRVAGLCALAVAAALPITARRAEPVATRLGGAGAQAEPMGRPVASGRADLTDPHVARLTPIVADLGVHGATSVARAPNGRVYFTREDGVYAYDPARRTSDRLFGRPAADVAVSRRGDQLAFGAGDDQAVWTVRLDPRSGVAIGAPRRLGLHTGRAPSFSPDGRLVAYSALPATDTLVAPRIVIVPAAGGPERVVASEPGFAQSLRWSPDGRWIYYWHGQPTARGPLRTIHRIRRDGGVPEVLAPAEQLVGLSPDGTLMAYGVTRPRLSTAVEKTVVVAALGGREAGRLLLPRDAIPAGWGPGAQQLLVRRIRQTSGIHIADLHGRIRELTPISGSDEWPSLSPDGRHLRLQTTGAHPQLVTVDLATGRRRVLHTAARAGLFRWLTAHRVLFVPRDASAVTIVDVDGPGEARETRLPVCSGRLPVYSADDGDRVLCVVRRGTAHELHAISFAPVEDRLLRPIPFDEQERPMLALANPAEFVLAGSGRVEVLPVASGPSRLLFQAGDDEALFGNVMRVSDDGKWVGFLVSVGIEEGGKRARLELRLVPLSGGSMRTIPLPELAPLRYLGWDPARRYVSLFVERNGRVDVWLVPLSGEPPYALTGAEPFGIDMLSVAPDGNAFLYTASREGTSLWAADLAPILAPADPLPP